MFQSLKVPYRSNVPNFSIFRNDDLNNCAQGKRQRNTLNHFTATETQLQFTTTHTTRLHSTTVETQLTLITGTTQHMDTTPILH